MGVEILKVKNKLVYPYITIKISGIGQDPEINLNNLAKYG